jgi:hypothetical protein
VQLNQKLMFEVGRHTRQLESKNEELAYRASQTQHINEELILVNEQLLSVNKKIAVERDMAMARSMALEQLTHVTCSFDLTDKTSCLISDNAPELFDDGRLAPNKPWFWLDYVHPEDVALVESSQRKLTSDKESCCLYRIKTKNGETRVVFNHLRILEQEGTNVLVGSFVDVSRFTSESPNAARVHKT